MEILRSSAMRIVTALQAAINHNTTFMDTTAHILACTDKKRIGDFHEASCKMFQEHLSEPVVPDAQTFKGTGPGVNMAIEPRGETVAIVCYEQNSTSYKINKNFLKFFRGYFRCLFSPQKDPYMTCGSNKEGQIVEWLIENGLPYEEVPSLFESEENKPLDKRNRALSSDIETVSRCYLLILNILAW